MADLIGLMRAPSELSIGTAAVDNVLAAIREHLGLDVAFVSEFRRQDRVFRHVNARARSPIRQGDTCPLDQGYCQRIVDGRLPQLIADTRDVPAAMALPETQAIPIGSHLSVPVRLADGRVYGTLCCFGFSADPSLGERDLSVLKAFASLLGSQLDRDIVSEGSTSEAKARVTAALESGQPSIVYQPIFDLASGALVGLECLSRFHAEPNRTPDKWFAEAASVGLGVELELAAIRSGLDALHATPSEIFVAVNCSPGAILDARVQEFFQAEVDLNRVVLEITEHDYVHDYPVLLSVLAPLRAMGLRVAIDDAGAGYASLRHVLHIQPEKIKLDISLTRNVDCDPTRRALASALIAFGRETRAHIVAEGVETAAELQTLTKLGVHNAQGYFLARPMPLADALRQVMPSAATVSSAPASRRGTAARRE